MKENAYRIIESDINDEHSFEPARCDNCGREMNEKYYNIDGIFICEECLEECAVHL